MLHRRLVVIGLCQLLAIGVVPGTAGAREPFSDSAKVLDKLPDARRADEHIPLRDFRFIWELFR
jgi:hypothetical protein